jgi:hypothetical protein
MHFILWWVLGAIILYAWHRKFLRVLTESELTERAATIYRTLHLGVAFGVWLLLCTLISISYLILDTRTDALWIWIVFDLTSGVALAGFGYLLLVAIAARFVLRKHKR